LIMLIQMRGGKRRVEHVRRRRIHPYIAHLAGALLAGVMLVSTTLAQARPIDPPDPDPCSRRNPPPGCTVGNPKGTLAGVTRDASGVHVSGAASDPDAAGPVEVTIEINGRYVGSVLANGPGGAFSGTVGARAGSEVCARAINRNKGEDVQIGCRRIDIQVDPFGAVDEVTSTAMGLRVRGWAIDPDTNAATSVHVYVDGQDRRLGVIASTDRPDVAAANPGYGSEHGFDITLPGSKLHTSVCVDAVNQGPGDLRRLGCGRVDRAISLLTLNIEGTHEEWTNDNGQGSVGIPWRERYRRLARWMAASGTLPDLIALQEVPARKFWVTPVPNLEPPDYESLFVIIDQIERLTGAHYRIAYLSADYVRNGWNSLYQGKALIYNADRLRNTTTLVNAFAVAHDNTTRVGVHMRTSWPCAVTSPEFAGHCNLIDSTSQTDREGRHWVSSYRNPTTGEWARGPAAAVFELVAAPGKHIIVFNVHANRWCPSNGDQCDLAADRADQLALRALVDEVTRVWGPRPKLIPPIVAGDFNGGVDMPTSDLSTREATLPDFNETKAENIDFVLGGKSSIYQSSYEPTVVGLTYPAREPFSTGAERGYCGSVATVLADHCSVLAQYLPTE
jgi:endonuclease/exonuclease/phosphatase family metal-dependent hydrolase